MDRSMDNGQTNRGERERKRERERDLTHSFQRGSMLARLYQHSLTQEARQRSVASR